MTMPRESLAQTTNKQAKQQTTNKRVHKKHQPLRTLIVLQQTIIIQQQNVK
jgi:hypothetical protein